MATPAAAAVTYASLRQSVIKQQYAPLYLLHGEEGYFIDELVKLFENVIPEAERDFNLYTLYAPQTEIDTVIDTCRRFPMMTDRQVVILKEAQAIRADQLNKLHHYASQPSPTTILVICCRGAQAKGKDLIAAIKKSGGVIFESKKLNERNVDSTITGIVREEGLNIDAKSTAMLRDYIGTDASRLYNEISKLAMILGKGSTITPESIERNIGMSKDFNNFELVEAIAAKDAAKAFRIVEYFKSNPKNNPAVVTAATIFAYFSDLLIAHFTRDKSPSSLMGALGLKWQGQLQRYNTGLRNYNAYKVIEIISAIRRFDANSKGIGSRQNEYALLHDLVFHILTAPGEIVI